MSKNTDFSRLKPTFFSFRRRSQALPLYDRLFFNVFRDCNAVKHGILENDDFSYKSLKRKTTRILITFHSILKSKSSKLSFPNVFIWSYAWGIGTPAPIYVIIKVFAMYICYILGGAAFRREYPELAMKIKRLSLYSSFMTTFLAFLLSVLSLQSLIESTPIGMIKVAIYQPIIGFVLGWNVATMTKWWTKSPKMTDQAVRTMALVCSMQNVQYCMSLITNAFGAESDMFLRMITYPQLVQERVGN